MIKPDFGCLSFIMRLHLFVLTWCLISWLISHVPIITILSWEWLRMLAVSHSIIESYWLSSVSLCCLFSYLYTDCELLLTIETQTDSNIIINSFPQVNKNKTVISVYYNKNCLNFDIIIESSESQWGNSVLATTLYPFRKLCQNLKG